MSPRACWREAAQQPRSAPYAAARAAARALRGPQQRDRSPACVRQGHVGRRVVLSIRPHSHIATHVRQQLRARSATQRAGGGAAQVLLVSVARLTMPAARRGRAAGATREGAVAGLRLAQVVDGAQALLVRVDDRLDGVTRASHGCGTGLRGTWVDSSGAWMLGAALAQRVQSPGSKVPHALVGRALHAGGKTGAAGWQASPGGPRARSEASRARGPHPCRRPPAPCGWQPHSRGSAQA